MSINRVSISGNLTRDAELRTTQSGTSVLAFGVAVNDRRQNPQTGEWEDHPNFVDCVVFGNRAEALADILRKGTKVAVDGQLRYRSWETDGQRRSKLEVAVREVELMTQRDRQPRQGQGQVVGSQAAYPQQAAYGAYQQQAAPMSAQVANAPYPAPRRPVATPQPQPYQQQMTAVAPSAMDVYDEDIPF